MIAVFHIFTICGAVICHINNHDGCSWTIRACSKATNYIINRYPKIWNFKMCFFFFVHSSPVIDIGDGPETLIIVKCQNKFALNHFKLRPIQCKRLRDARWEVKKKRWRRCSTWKMCTNNSTMKVSIKFIVTYRMWFAIDGQSDPAMHRKWLNHYFAVWRAPCIEYRHRCRCEFSKTHDSDLMARWGKW